jgi:hypothetical protein
LPHDFAKSLRRSHSVADLPFWREVYERAFLGMLAMHDHRQDGEHQRAGIDRSIIMPNSKQILIDEKARFKNEKTGRVYEDIALEFLSDERRKEPGWVCKPLRAEYIAYAIAPLGRCYLLPVLQLQRAWAIHGEAWLKRHHRLRAENEYQGREWVTVSVGVPVAECFAAIGSSLRIQFTPYEEEPKPKNGHARKDFGAVTGIDVPF